MSPYFEGYLTAEAFRTFIQDRVTKNMPKCPYPEDTQAYRSWHVGVSESTMDRELGNRRHAKSK